jgi:hypothetical protein
MTLLLPFCFIFLETIYKCKLQEIVAVATTLLPQHCCHNIVATTLLPQHVVYGDKVANRLNDIIPLLSDRWLDESESQMKKTLETKILEIVPAKCNDGKNVICDIFYS